MQIDENRKEPSKAACSNEHSRTYGSNSMEITDLQAQLCSRRLSSKSVTQGSNSGTSTAVPSRNDTGVKLVTDAGNMTVRIGVKLPVIRRRCVMSTTGDRLLLLLSARSIVRSSHGISGGMSTGSNSKIEDGQSL
jgi:hypothetical protein